MTQQLPNHYHLSVKLGMRGKGFPHFQYVCREGPYQDGARYKDLVATGEGNLPSWAVKDPGYFWEASDRFERMRGSVYREFEVALSRELTPNQWKELVETFVRQEIGLRHVYQWAIHCPKAALDEGEQPHAHIMFSDRTLDGIERGPQDFFMRANTKHPERGGCKKANVTRSFADRKADLIALRARWATLQNEFLAKCGHEARVDHRSLVDRGITRAPEQHLGPVVIGRMRSSTRRKFLGRREHNRQHDLRSRTSIVDPSFQVSKVRQKRKVATNDAFPGIELDSKTTMIQVVPSQALLENDPVQSLVSNATGELSDGLVDASAEAFPKNLSLEPVDLVSPPASLIESPSLEKAELEDIFVDVKANEPGSPSERQSQQQATVTGEIEPQIEQPLPAIRIKTPAQVDRNVRHRLRPTDGAAVRTDVCDSAQPSNGDGQLSAENVSGESIAAKGDSSVQFQEMESADETTEKDAKLSIGCADADSAKFHVPDQPELNNPESCQDRSDVSKPDYERDRSVESERRETQPPSTIRIKTSTQMRRNMQNKLQNITGTPFESGSVGSGKRSKEVGQLDAENTSANGIELKGDPAEPFQELETTDETTTNDIASPPEDGGLDSTQFHEPDHSEPNDPESGENEPDISSADDENNHGFDGP
jgi:hypothetical protein